MSRLATMLRSTITLAVPASLLIGCSISVTPSPSATPTPTAEQDRADVSRPMAAGELVLRVDFGGGLLPPLGRERQVPAMSIYGDGLVLVPRQTAVADVEPAGTELEAFRLDAQLVDEIVAAGREVGLQGPDRGLPQEGPELVADAGATIVTLVADGTRHVTTAGALFDTPDTSRERALLQQLVERLFGLRPTAGGVEPYEPSAYRVFVAAPDPGFGPELEDAVPVAWPFDEPLASWGEPIPPDGLTVDARCRVVDATAFTDTAAVLLAATTQTVVADAAGDEAIVAYRPLLPDDAGC